MLKQLSRRAALLGGGVILGAFLGRRYAPRTHSADGTTSLVPPGAESTLNDASRLSETPVLKHVVADGETGGTLAERVRREVAQAGRSGSPVVLGGVRHSMGAQSIPAFGHAITLTSRKSGLRPERRTFYCDAGARWSDVMVTLAEEGFAPKVMQANPDLTLAGSFSVNAHGWPVAYGPMGSTVRSVDMVLSTGERISASRLRNPDIFRLAMGGYGLVGGIIALEVEYTEDIWLRPRYTVMDATEFGTRFTRAALSGENRVAYGRLSIERGALFEQAVLVEYRPTEASQEELDAEVAVERPISDRLFRWQEDNESIKRLSWWADTTMLRFTDLRAIRLNTLLATPDLPYGNPAPNRTDILHEYFLPPDRFDDFVAACREEIPASYQELLDATVRFVQSDPESVLSYATAPRLGLFMLFSQEMTRRAESDHRRMTQALIERVLDLGGTYYLPYRPHATEEQFVRAYPGAETFAAEKRRLDPALMFRNALWDKYLAPLG